MSALADRTAVRVAAGIERLGSLGSLIIGDREAFADGVAAVPGTTVAVILAGPVDESKRYAATGADTRTAATFYLAAKGLTVEPSESDRISIHGKTWAIVGLTPYELKGTKIGYALDVGEIGNG